jgi:WD repeat-containing protein 42A
MSLGTSPHRNAEDSEKEKENEEEEEEDVGPHQEAPKPQVYEGHRNHKTVKGVNFFGPNSEYVVSGSDCGRIYIWRKKGGKLVALMRGDDSVVNCLEPHPHATVLATSGIDYTVKVWAPYSERLIDLPQDAERVCFLIWKSKSLLLFFLWLVTQACRFSS